MIMASKKLILVSGILAAAVVVILGLIPAIVKTNYIIHLLVVTFIWIIMTSGLNIIQGYAGYVSLCQMTFYGISAYISGNLANKLGMPFIGNILLAIVIGYVFGTLIGLPTLRTKGHYFSIATMSFAMLSYVIFDNWYAFTGGSGGFAVRKLSGAIFGFKLNSSKGFYYLALLIAVIAVIFVYRLIRSKTGRAIISLRENENLAESIGIDTTKVKRLAFTLSAILGSVGGVLYSYYLAYVNPTAFNVSQSLNAILAVMLGGCGTVLGPVVGSAIIVFLPEFLRVADLWRQLIFGILLIIIVFILPEGLVPMVGRLIRLIFRRRKTSVK